MTRIAVSALALAALVVPACEAGSSHAPIASTEEPQVGAINGRWPSRTIPVCWVTPSSDASFVAEQANVQTAVTTAYAAAGVTFTGWAPCDASLTADHIAITVSDNQPFTQVGHHATTAVGLSFVMQNAGPTAARAHCSDGARLDGCIKMAAVHEFGHALGLSHEEDRADPLINCGFMGRRLFDDFNVDLGPVDPSSVLNHCNPQLFGVPTFPDQPALSAGDVTAVQFLFGTVSPNTSITLSISSSLFPWYFLHTDSSGNAAVVPIDGPLGSDALFNVVPAQNGDPTMVSLQSTGDPAQFLCNDDASNPVHLVAGCDPALSSWRIDTTTNIGGDAGLRFVLPSGRVMNIGPSPANQVFTALPADVPNPQEMDFIPRTQVPERLLRTALDDVDTQPFTAGTYLAHVGGSLVLEKLPAGQTSDGNWELVAGLDDPQLVSIRFTDAQGNQFFIMEQSGQPALVAAASVTPSRATFTRVRNTEATSVITSYRFIEELGGNLELCAPNGVVSMCPSTDVSPEASFFQGFPIPDSIPGVDGTGADTCAQAVSACLSAEPPTFESLSSTCQQLGGLEPPCFFEPPNGRGSAINDGSDPVASLFPLSVVSLETPGTAGCTGVILTSTSILTAAHCGVGPTTIVHFYGLTSSDGNVPVATLDIPASSDPVATQNDLTCSRDDLGFPGSCFLTGSDGVSRNADLAVLTLSQEIPSQLGYTPVVLGPRGFGGQGLAGTALPSWWEVAAGGPTPVDGQSPAVWAPVSYVSSSDATQAQGYFSVRSAFGTGGDTGGPIFQAGASPSDDAGAGGADDDAGTGSDDADAPDGGFKLPMTLVGLVSRIGACNESPCVYTDDVVSVTQPDTYDWLTSLGASPVPALQSFGAAN